MEEIMAVEGSMVLTEQDATISHSLETGLTSLHMLDRLKVHQMILMQTIIIVMTLFPPILQSIILLYLLLLILLSHFLTLAFPLLLPI